MQLSDFFWNFGALTNPNEPWAVDVDTQVGIQVALMQRSCQEELSRVSQEVRQAMNWAVGMSKKIDILMIPFDQSESPVHNLYEKHQHILIQLWLYV